MFSLVSAFCLKHQDPLAQKGVQNSDPSDRYYLKKVELPKISTVCFIADQLSVIALATLFALSVTGILPGGSMVGYILIAGAALQFSPSLLAAIWHGGHGIKAIILQKNPAEQNAKAPASA